MKHAIVVPVRSWDHFGKFLYSCNARTSERLIVIDNTEEQFYARGTCAFPVFTGGHTEDHNLGVAASWNLGVSEALIAGAEYVTLCSTSIRFTDGGEQLCDITDFCIENTQWPWGFESLNGWHLITFGYRTLELVGEFDENYYPAYYEDCDYVHRMRLAGVLEPKGEVRHERKMPWVPTLKYPCSDGATLAAGLVAPDWDKIRDYHEAKWGTRNGGEEVFTQPFGGTNAKTNHA